MAKNKLTYKEIEERLELITLFHNESQSLSKIGSWSWNLKTGEVIWSDMMFSLFGLKTNEIKPSFETALNFLVKGDKKEYEAVISNSLKTKTPYILESRIINKNENEIPVISKGVFLFDKNNEAIEMVGTVRNISKQKEDQRLALEKVKLMEHQETKNIIHTSITHDLRAPFNGLIGFNTLLEAAIKSKNFEEIKEYSKVIAKITTNTFTFLDKLLDWSDKNTEVMTFMSQKTNLKTLITSICDEFKSLASLRGVIIIESINSAFEVNVDREMVKIIIRNLLSNAIKFTKENGDINLSAIINANKIQVSVTDSGIGIAPINLETIFDNNAMMSNYDSKGEKKKPNTGLGLMLSKKLIHKNNGDIWVQSIVGIGTSFHLTLPNSEMLV